MLSGCGALACNFACIFEEARRRARSCPFDPDFAAIDVTFCARSNAAIGVANGHDLGPLRAS